MPKIKTKSGTKKRFKVTGNGKIKASASRLRHGMSKRPQKMKRQGRGTAVMNASDQSIVLKYMPYSR